MKLYVLSYDLEDPRVFATPEACAEAVENILEEEEAYNPGLDVILEEVKDPEGWTFWVIDAFERRYVRTNLVEVEG